MVDRGNGDLEIWKDDNAILRRPGVVERSQRFDDGSTLTTLEQDDGSRVVTIRDATGRVLRRERVLADGSVVQLFDDTRQFAPVSVSTLPQPRVETRSTRHRPPARSTAARPAEANL